MSQDVRAEQEAQEVAAVRERLAALPDDAVPEQELKHLEEGLQTIEDIPSEVIDQGEAAVQEWVAQHHPSTVGPGGVKAEGYWEVSKCVGAILLAIGSAAIPAAKLLKLKKFIEKVGSVREAAFLLIRIAKGEEKIEELGSVLGALAGEIIGITSIRENCF
jgi:hypothetical protein